MSKKTYRSSRGVPVDIEAIKLRNEKTIAAGNIAMNAKGDLLKRGGEVDKTVSDVARLTAKEAPVTLQKGVSLKGKRPKEEEIEKDKPAKKTSKKEVTLDNGDIIIKDGDEDES